MLAAVSRKKTSVLCLALLLAACGGGGGGSNPSGVTATSTDTGATGATGSNSSAGNNSGASGGSTSTQPNSGGLPNNGISGSTTAPNASNGGQNNSGSTLQPPGGTAGGNGSGPTTPAGQDGSIFAYDAGARFNLPSELFLDNAGNILVRDDGNQAIRQITPTGDVSTRVASYPERLDTIDPDGNIYYFMGNNPDIYQRTSIDLYRVRPDGTTTLVMGFQESPGTTTPIAVRADMQGQLHILVRYRTQFWILKVDPNNPPQGTFWGNGAGPHDVAYHLGTYGELLTYVSDKNGNLAVASTGPVPDTDVIHYVPLSAQPAEGASSGVTARSVAFRDYVRLTIDQADNLYMVDAKRENLDENTVRVSEMRVVKIAPDGTTTTLLNGFPDGRASSDVPRSSIYRFGIVADKSGNVYVTDPYEHAIYRISSSGQLALFAGKPEEAGNSN